MICRPLVRQRWAAIAAAVLLSGCADLVAPEPVGGPNGDTTTIAPQGGPGRSASVGDQAVTAWERYFDGVVMATALLPANGEQQRTLAAMPGLLRTVMESERPALEEMARTPRYYRAKREPFELGALGGLGGEGGFAAEADRDPISAFNIWAPELWKDRPVQPCEVAVNDPTSLRLPNTLTHAELSQLLVRRAAALRLAQLDALSPAQAARVSERFGQLLAGLVATSGSWSDRMADDLALFGASALWGLDTRAVRDAEKRPPLTVEELAAAGEVRDAWRAVGIDFVVDVGGEGRYAHVFNVNPLAFNRSGETTTTGTPGRPIPNLIDGLSQRVPVPDGSLDCLISESTPPDVKEFFRALRPGGRVMIMNGPWISAEFVEVAAERGYSCALREMDFVKPEVEFAVDATTAAEQRKSAAVSIAQIVIEKTPDQGRAALGRCARLLE